MIISLIVNTFEAATVIVVCPIASAPPAVVTVSLKYAFELAQVDTFNELPLEPAYFEMNFPTVPL